MSAASAITPAALDTVIALLAPFFLIGSEGDMATARQAAARTLADYGAETQEELRLATEVVSFGFQALQALAEAADPTLPVTRLLRLRGSAVSLNRSAQQNQRKLDLLQRQRRGVRVLAARPDAREAPSSIPPPPDLDLMLGFIQSAASRLMAGMGEAEPESGVEQRADAVSTPAEPPSQKKAGVWSRAAQQQRVAERLAENQRRKQAEAARQHAAPGGVAAAPNRVADARHDAAGQQAGAVLAADGAAVPSTGIAGIVAAATPPAAMSSDRPMPAGLDPWATGEAAQAAA